jgi:hypothetical protein
MVLIFGADMRSGGQKPVRSPVHEISAYSAVCPPDRAYLLRPADVMRSRTWIMNGLSRRVLRQRR